MSVTRQQSRPGEPEEPGQPTPMMPQVQVAHPDNPEPMEENEITTMSSLMSPPEIEVDPVQEMPQRPDASGMTVIRMNTSLDDFTFGDPNRHYKLVEGKRYRVPANIGRYLDGLGYVWH